MGRLNRCIHVFNECTCIQQNNRTNWDLMKSLTELVFTAEPKGKESFRATDPAGVVFMSNHLAPVLVANDDRRYAATTMNPKYRKNRKYWRALAEAVNDPCVQRAYFTHLVNRDLSKYEQRNIPDMQCRNALKENKSKNHILKYLANAVTLAGSTLWYRNDIERKEYRFYSVDRVKAGFYKFCEDNSIAKNYQLWTTIRKNLDQAGLVVKRVTDRCDDAEIRRQVLCMQLDKEIVRDIHRRMLDNPTWDFPKVEDTDAVVADRDRCIFGDQVLHG